MLQSGWPGRNTCSPCWNCTNTMCLHSSKKSGFSKWPSTLPGTQGSTVKGQQTSELLLPLLTTRPPGGAMCVCGMISPVVIRGSAAIFPQKALMEVLICPIRDEQINFLRDVRSSPASRLAPIGRCLPIMEGNAAPVLKPRGTM